MALNDFYQKIIKSWVGIFNHIYAFTKVQTPQRVQRDIFFQTNIISPSDLNSNPVELINVYTLGHGFINYSST